MIIIPIGLIGCGQISEWVHLKILTSLPRAELRAFADSCPERRQLAQRAAPRAVACDTFEQLLVMPELAAVVICLPNAMHAEATIHALQNDKHVYLEKPLARNPAEALGVLRVWQPSGKAGMVGFNLRFNPIYMAARKAIQSGRLGDVLAVRCVRTLTAMDMPAWKQRRETGGGVLLDLASHHIDLVHYLFNQQIVKASAVLHSCHSEHDHATVQLHLQSGLVIQSFFSFGTVDEDRFEIYGRAGKITADRYDSLRFESASSSRSTLSKLRQSRRSWLRWAASPSRPATKRQEPSYSAAMADFVDAVLTDRPPSPDFFDGYRALAVIDALENSANTGGDVAVRYETNGDLLPK